jgi:tetratricopeptide (TPR) repeat protein
MLAGNLLTAERFEEALAIAERGLTESEPGGREQLAGLRCQIELRLLELMMAPARHHYRQGNFPRARSALKKLDKRYQRNPLWVTFHRYLQDLGGSLGGLVRGKAAVQVRPSGRFVDVDAMHFFLVREELARAKSLLATNHMDQAGNVLEQVLTYTPHFPYAHFLRGICLYREVLQTLAGGRFPGPGIARGSLETALAHARTATEDDEIAETGSLISTIEGAIAVMREVEHMVEIHAREDEKVNVVIAKYQTAMKGVGNGIGSPEQWRQVRSMMLELRPEIRDLEASIRRPNGKEALARLAKAVERNLQQLESMKDAITEADQVHKLMAEFQDIMSSAQGGITSLAQIKALAQRLAALKFKITTAQPQVRSYEGKQTLAQLTASVDRNASQLAGIRSGGM